MILPSSIGMIIFVLRYEKDRVHEAIRKNECHKGFECCSNKGPISLC